MARQFQLRGDTEAHWIEANPILAEREVILISTDPLKPTLFDQTKIGDGLHRYTELPFRGLPAVQQRGNSPVNVMSQKAVTQELELLEKNINSLVESNHRQNTDEGTDQRSFYIHRIRLENCHAGLELRNFEDTDYDNLTLRDLTVKGKLIADKGITETEVQQVKTKNNLIILNEGETGEGISKGISGIDIDRGSGEHYFILFDENDDSLKAGFGTNLDTFAFKKEVILKQQLKIVSQLPETAEDGDFFIIPANEEEDGKKIEDFIKGYTEGKERTVNYIEIQATPEGENEENQVITLTAKATFPVTSEINILLKCPDDSWWPGLSIAIGDYVSPQINAPAPLLGTLTAIKLEPGTSDENYIYAIRQKIQIPG